MIDGISISKKGTVPLNFEGEIVLGLLRTSLKKCYLNSQPCDAEVPSLCSHQCTDELHEKPRLLTLRHLTWPSQQGPFLSSNVT